MLLTMNLCSNFIMIYFLRLFVWFDKQYFGWKKIFRLSDVFYLREKMLKINETYRKLERMSTFYNLLPGRNMFIWTSNKKFDSVYVRKPDWWIYQCH
jgi:hypothetical protein